MIERVRRHASLVGGVLWLLVAALVPLFHSIGHEDDHTHLPNGGIVYHDASAPDEAPRPADPPKAHGGGSVAHLGGLWVLGLVFLAPLAVGLGLALAPRLPRLAAPRTLASPPRARGPPRLDPFTA